MIFLKHLTHALSLPWTGGLALVVLCVGNQLLRSEGEDYEWAQYLLLGTLFPLLVVVVSLLPYFRSGPVIHRSLTVGLTLTGLVLAAPFLARHLNTFILSMTAIQVLATGWLRYPAWRREAEEPASLATFLLLEVPYLFVTALIALCGWTVCRTLFWWHLEMKPFEGWVTEATLSMTVLGVAFVLVMVRLGPSLLPSAWSWLPARPAAWVSMALAVPVLALASVRTDRIFQEGETLVSFHHWSPVIGPAEMVLQGGWIFWDVPAVYGFLSTLTIAYLPAETVWQALYHINLLFLFLIALFLFLLLHAFRPGLLNGLFALAMALAGVLLIPGSPFQTISAHGYPQVSAFRFFWCLALLAILVWENQREHTGQAKWPVLVAGVLLWWIGGLWSVESAVYCTAVWGPAYLLIVTREAILRHGQGHSWRRGAVWTGGWLGLPIALVLLTVTFLHWYYVRNLGHPPDWLALLEFARANRLFSIMPVNRAGPVWVNVLILAAIAGTGACFFAKKNWRPLPALAGAWGACWATASYFVVNSHESNVTNLKIVFCPALAVTLYVLARERALESWAAVLKSACVPLFTVLLTITLGNPILMENVVHGMRNGYQPQFDQLIPVIPDSLAELLDRGGVKPHDPLIYLHGDGHGMYARPVLTKHGLKFVTSYKAWLPMHPQVLIWPLYTDLTKKRILEYNARFIDRSRLSGYLVIQAAAKEDYPWLFEQLEQTHKMTRRLENAEHVLFRFEFQEADPPMEAAGHPK